MKISGQTMGVGIIAAKYSPVDWENLLEVSKKICLYLDSTQDQLN